VGEGSEPVRLRDVLSAAAGRLRLGHPVEMGTLWARWPDIVGPAIAAHVEPTSLRERVLRVRADSPTWATEIGYLRDEIKARANVALGTDVVAEVRVWTGPGRVRAARGSGTEALAHPARVPARDALEALGRARRAWAARRAQGREADR
jgi:predicted nucleic acid-binding Zn ribbon protein